MNALCSPFSSCAASLLADAGPFTRLWFGGESASPIGREADDLYIGIFWLSVVCFVILMALMTVFAVKYRRKPGVAAPRSPSHNTVLELAWTIVPLFILAVLFFKGFKTYMQHAVAPGNAIEFSLIGKRWDWELTYTNGAIVTETTMIGSKSSPIFYMPAGRPIKLRMNSLDVIHAFWVPDYRIKFDVYPNRYTMVWFQTEPAEELTGKLGKEQGIAEKSPIFGKPFRDHIVFCAEYCGDMHSEMSAIIRVVDEQTYSDWALESLDRLPLVELGAALYKTRGCITCHSIDGSKNTGPTWKNMFGHALEFTNGTSFTAEQMSDTTFFANYVRESMLEPAKLVVKTFPNQMTSLQGTIREKEINALIAFMISLSDKQPIVDPAAPASAEPAPAPAPGAPTTPTTPAPGH